MELVPLAGFPRNCATFPWTALTNPQPFIIIISQDRKQRGFIITQKQFHRTHSVLQGFPELCKQVQHFHSHSIKMIISQNRLQHGFIIIHKHPCSLAFFYNNYFAELILLGSLHNFIEFVPLALAFFYNHRTLRTGCCATFPWTQIFIMIISQNRQQRSCMDNSFPEFCKQDAFIMIVPPVAFLRTSKADYHATISQNSFRKT